MRLGEGCLQFRHEPFLVDNEPEVGVLAVNPYVLSFSLQRYEIMWTSDDFFTAIIIAEGILGQRPLNKESAGSLRGCLSMLLLRDSFL